MKLTAASVGGLAAVVVAVLLLASLPGATATLSSKSTYLIARYSFDVDGTDNHGDNTYTANGSLPNVVAGVLGNAQDFNSGVPDYFTKSHDTDFDNMQDGFTLSFWINPQSEITSHGVVYQKATSGGVTEWFQCYVYNIAAGDSFRCVVDGTSGLSFEADAGDLEPIVDDGSTWTHIVFTYNGSSAGAPDIWTYFDGTNYSDNDGRGQMDESNDDYAWTGSSPNNDHLDAYIDELCVWDKVLSAGEINALYNGGSGANCDGSSPSAVTVTVTAQSPADNDHDNQRNRTFNFDVDTTGAGASTSVNATLWINDSTVGDVWIAHSNFSNVEISNGSDRNTTTEIWLNESVVDWIIEVRVNDTDSDNTTARNLVIDLTNPVINRHAGEGHVAVDNTTVFNIHHSGDSINASYNATDSYMFGFNVTLTLANGTKVYSNQTTGLTGTVSYETFLFNLTTKPIQATNLTYNWTASDDHTSPIPDYQVNSQKSKITFKTPNNNNIKIETADPSDITAEKLTDRYSFTMSFDDGLTTTRTFHVKTDKCPLYYRSHTPFQGHFVSFCAGSGNWIDFEGNGENPVVTKIDSYHWTVTLDNVPPLTVFTSVGGLNLAERITTAEITLWPDNPATLQSPNQSITWIMTNWTAGTGASFYAVYRDGVNVANTSALLYNHTGLTGGTDYTINVHSVFNNSEVYYENFSALPQITQQTIFNGTLAAEVRNEVTNTILTGVPVFISLIGSNNNVTGNTTTGTLGLTNISSDNYTIRHSAIGWGSRDQYLEIGENDSGSILLYLINDTIRDPGIVFVRDTQSEGVNGSIVKLQRFFNDENLYRVVQMATTNEDGRAVFDAEAFDAYYKWVVEYNGVTEVLTTAPEFLARDSTSGLWTKAFTINIGTDFWESYVAKTAMAHSINFTPATRTLTYTYNDPAGLINLACIKAEYANGTSWDTVGPTCLAAATGSINLQLPDENRTYHYTGFYETSTKYSEEAPVKGAVTLGSPFDYGLAGTFIGLMLLLGVIPLFAFNAVAGVIVTILLTASLSLFNAFALFPFGWEFIMGLTVIGIGFIVFAMRRN